MVSDREGKHLVSASMPFQSFLELNICFPAKFFISLNPFFGCDVGCKYCYRLSHVNIFDVFLSPKRLVSDEEAVEHLEKHLKFQDNEMPIALHDSSTDPEENRDYFMKRGQMGNLTISSDYFLKVTTKM